MNKLTSLVFCILSLLSVNSSAIDFDLNNIEVIEVHYLDGKKSEKGKSWKKREVTFAYKSEPVSDIVAKILSASGKKAEGLEALKETRRLVMMKKVTAFKAVTTLLKCEGYRLVEQHESFQVIKDPKINRNACLY